MKDSYIMTVVDDKYNFKGFVTGDSLKEIKEKARINNLQLYGKLLPIKRISVE